MVRLTIKYGDKIIAEKNVSKEEFDELNAYLETNFVIEYYKKYFGLDISNYRLSEFDALPSLESFKEFNVKIRSEDLAKLRDNKIKNILE